MDTIVEAEEHDLHAPALCDVEMTAVLRRALLRRRLDSRRARAALADYLDLPLVRHGHRGLLGRILELGRNFSAYDAAYVSLAERLGGTLLTADEALARAARKHADVPVVPD